MRAPVLVSEFEPLDSDRGKGRYPIDSLILQPHFQPLRLLRG